ncbi:SixA phosphatase family protein [Winogradskyella flava]|uniref:Histidine phosphatase family protein n=1 Tax=Winogradskyella flava TaxID=1884876 RepID=A0A842IRS1_9FLAO|nr:histidine phosphatase family protein [Winogradskyella flava]MBC2844869.1 histidine phosphatase family protein [Winogradskyella flava]
MKILTLVRHGKSSWEFDVSDDKRPLKSRGRSDAKLVANQFINNNQLPQMVFSSPAKRALETCKIFTQTIGFSENSVIIEDDLYDFGGENVIKFVKSLSNEIDDVMIFGHNHAFTSIANIFGDTYIDNLPTSGLVRLNFEINKWEDLEKGRTEYIIVPKELR